MTINPGLEFATYAGHFLIYRKMDAAKKRFERGRKFDRLQIQKHCQIGLDILDKIVSRQR